MLKTVLFPRSVAESLLVMVRPLVSRTATRLPSGKTWTLSWLPRPPPLWP